MKKKNGFTLIELILGLCAGAIVSFCLAFIFSPIDNWSLISSRRLGGAESQTAMERMVREIENTKGPTFITTLTADHLTFTDTSDQAVDFYLNGTDLYLGSYILARNVSSISFVYKDIDGNVTATAANVRTVEITLTLTSGVQTIYLQSKGVIRNGT